MSKNQKELLLWKSILGHFDVRNTQNLIRGGIIPTKLPGARTYDIPMCRVCVVGKYKRVGITKSKYIINPEHTDVIKQEDLLPGERVSMDQFECRIKGRLPYTKVGEIRTKYIMATLCLWIMRLDM